MAVVSVKTLHDGWSGTFTKSASPSFNVVYLVEVDDPTDGNMAVVAADGIPLLGSSYRVGEDSRADVLLKSLSTAPIAGTRNLWQVTASYGSTEQEDQEKGDPTDGKTEDGAPTNDPLKFAVSMSMSTSRVTRDAIVGTFLGVLDGDNFMQQGFNDGNAPPKFHDNVTTKNSGKINNGRAITNSAYTAFDPPAQTEYNRTNVKIKFNTLNTPVKIMPYINSINSKPLTITVNYMWDDPENKLRKSTASVTIPSYAGRLMGITTSPSKRNGIGFHENQIEIEIDKLYGWRLDILDRGYSTSNKEEMFGGDSASEAKPKLDAVVTEDGFASREPILLDGKGQALDVKRSQGVFIRYGVYPEKDWKLANLNNPTKLQGVD
tara:strand:- start:393 stop:1523 length:1131 start_codon:yes stop_codon:yes gene_type:complete